MIIISIVMIIISYDHLLHIHCLLTSIFLSASDLISEDLKLKDHLLGVVWQKMDVDQKGKVNGVHYDLLGLGN